MLEAKQTIEQQNNEIILHNQILDKQVKERTYELVEYNQQLEQFAFITAHNLRAPLARILGLGQVLKLGQLTKEETQSVTEKMSFTAEELDHVTKDSNVCDVTGKVIRIIAKTVEVTTGNGKSIIGVTQKTAVSNPKKKGYVVTDEDGILKVQGKEVARVESGYKYKKDHGCVVHCFFIESEDAKAIDSQIN